MNQNDAPVAARDRSGGAHRSDSLSPDSAGRADDSPVVEQPPGENRLRTDSAVADGPRPAAASTGRWWAVVGMTSVFSMPFGWLLSYAAGLPFYLGLFFFALFGLVIGAVACRMAAPAGPFPRRTVTAGTTIIIASCWLTSIVTECYDFPRSMAEKAVAAASTLGGRDLSTFRASVEETSREIIKSQSGGPIFGYIRWVVTDGDVKANTFEGVHKALRPVHRRQGWVIRVLVSIALLSFGIATQTWPLRLGTDGKRTKPASSE